jgi:hypothetical protein
MKKKIKVDDIEITIVNKDGKDFFCVTDIARKFNSKRPNDTVRNYFRNGKNIEYMSAWEQLNNKDFNNVESDVIRIASYSNAFTLSAKEWIERTGATGIFSEVGRYGGTYASKDIAYQFAMWLSPVFQLFIVTEFDRLKQIEEKTDTFYLNKMFDNTLENNRIVKQFLQNRGELPGDEKE